MNDQIYSRRELREMILPLIRKYDAADALLFGSYARNEATKDSDIDVVIIGGDDFVPTNVFAIAEDLHEASGKAVDVYELREINVGTPFYQTVLSEGVRLR